MAPVRDAGARRRKKPWGAPASFGLGAAKTPGRVVVASRRAGAPPPDDKENANPLYAHVKSRVACTTAKGELDAMRAAPRPLDANRARLKPARAPAPAPAPADNMGLGGLSFPTTSVGGGDPFGDFGGAPAPAPAVPAAPAVPLKPAEPDVFGDSGFGSLVSRAAHLAPCSPMRDGD